MENSAALEVWVTTENGAEVHIVKPQDIKAFIDWAGTRPDTYDILYYDKDNMAFTEITVDGDVNVITHNLWTPS